MFNAFAFQNNNDFLLVYDGPSTANPLLGSFTGTALPPALSSTGGALTIVMTTDNSTTMEGFEATWQCFIPTTPPQADFSYTFFNGCAGVVQFADLSNNAFSWLSRRADQE